MFCDVVPHFAVVQGLLVCICIYIYMCICRLYCRYIGAPGFTAHARAPMVFNLGYTPKLMQSEVGLRAYRGT